MRENRACFCSLILAYNGGEHSFHCNVYIPFKDAVELVPVFWGHAAIYQLEQE